MVKNHSHRFCGHARYARPRDSECHTESLATDSAASEFGNEPAAARWGVHARMLKYRPLRELCQIPSRVGPKSASHPFRPHFQESCLAQCNARGCSEATLSTAGQTYVSSSESSRTHVTCFPAASTGTRRTLANNVRLRELCSGCKGKAALCHKIACERAIYGQASVHSKPFFDQIRHRPRRSARAVA